ncbi:DUF1571 domain-containing protein [bacterium]|nr:DUF1571 domain-containing protein [bacterium]
MKFKKFGFFMPVLFLGSILVWSQPLQAENFDALDILKKSQEKFEQINDYTATFIKEQRVNGKMTKDVIEMKFMKPFCIYYKFLEKDKGKEVIYVEGKNDNKLLGHLGGAISFFPICRWLKPNDPIAMMGNKYPITRSGIGNMIKGLVSQYELADKNGDLETFYMGIETLDGRRTHVIGRRLPKKDKYACYLSITNIDIETKLPIRNISLDWDLNILEMYYYKDLKINQGLTDKDFDPNNSKYRFGFFKF